jgi:hypothetical protein
VATPQHSHNGHQHDLISAWVSEGQTISNCSSWVGAISSIMYFFKLIIVFKHFTSSVTNIKIKYFKNFFNESPRSCMKWEIHEDNLENSGKPIKNFMFMGTGKVQVDLHLFGSALHWQSLPQTLTQTIR